MDKDVRNRIQRATQDVRALLEREVSEQLVGVYDVPADGVIPDNPGSHLDDQGRLTRDKVIAAIDHRVAGGSTSRAAVAGYTREAAFTLLNRFVALKMLESRGLVQPCISQGQDSSGFREFGGLAPGLVELDDHGYRLYLESLFDEVAREVGVLFDRRDPAGIFWPRRQALTSLLGLLNQPELAEVWADDETIGWIYQYFNSGEERKEMREQSQAPRNTHELAVRNQFFTPRYVVQFLVDNTLGRVWIEMTEGDSALTEACEYFVRSSEPLGTRPRRDPRDLKILDPACGSGHFLLYCFDLLMKIYEEAWSRGETPASDATGSELREDYSNLDALRCALPRLILDHNLHGVDVDRRCAQIAALALWLRAQRAWHELGVPASDRPQIRRTHVVVAEPMPGEQEMVDEFAAAFEPPLVGVLFQKMVEEMRLAGDLGPLLKAELGIGKALARAREQFVEQTRSGVLPGLGPTARPDDIDLAGIDDDGFFREAEIRIVDALHTFAQESSSSTVSRRLFSDDAAEGVALIELVRARYEVVLMNPPFGAGSLAAKKEFEKAYPRTKNDLYAAFVERGIELLHPGGFLGAITSRTGFFLSSFQKWREEILLKEAPPVVFADLGYGILDSAMVEVAAYCLRRV